MRGVSKVQMYILIISNYLHRLIDFIFPHLLGTSLTAGAVFDNPCIDFLDCMWRGHEFGRNEYCSTVLKSIDKFCKFYKFYPHMQQGHGGQNETCTVIFVRLSDYVPCQLCCATSTTLLNHPVKDGIFKLPLICEGAS